MTKKLADKVWVDGALVDWEDATIHVISHVIHYGSSVFEGIRAYEVRGTPHVFRLQDHIRRLYDSAKIYRMEIPYSKEEFEAACAMTITANRFRACYLRPLVFREQGAVGVNPLRCRVKNVILTWEWGAYLGEDALAQGVDACVASWRRLAPNTHAGLAKAGGNYLNSQLMKIEAITNGYVEGIALNPNGYLSEGSGENLFIVRDGRLYTPPLSAGILAGITRHSVITLARERGLEVLEQTLPREALYIADEAFFTGTAAEITPIRSVDRVPIGAGRRGPITEVLQSEFLGITKGEIEDRHRWLTPVR